MSRLSKWVLAHVITAVNSRLDSISLCYNDIQAIHNVTLYFAVVLTEVRGLLTILSLFLITPKVQWYIR